MHDMQEEAGAPLNSGATPTVPPSRVSGRPLALVAVAALGVIAAALVVMATGWRWVDPLVGAGIGPLGSRP